MTTFGGGTFGSNVVTFDGNTISPVDTTFLSASYTPNLPIAASFSVVSIAASESVVPVPAMHAPDVSIAATSIPEVQADGSYVPVLSKAGSP